MTVKVGFREGYASDPRRRNWSNDGPRPIRWSAWYPAVGDAVERTMAVPPSGPLFIMGTVARDAAINQACARFPVVLLSHGTGGTAASLGWIAEALAAAGYVVIGVDHHGNTASEPYRAEGFLCWWERPSDLSVALDLLASEGVLAGRLDTVRVACLGFSLGGYTVLSLLGAITEASRFDEWAGSSQLGPQPREFPDLGDWIEPLRRDSPVFRASCEHQSVSCRDRRVATAIVLAPAPPVRAFTPDSLAGITGPVTLMVGEADHDAPMETCAVWLNERLPNCELYSLGRDVGHYTLLCAGTDGGREREPTIFVDAPGVDRREVHRQAIRIVLTSIVSGLSASTGAQLPECPMQEGNIP